jgi:serine/threonine-protein phosphatase CPPED1
MKRRTFLSLIIPAVVFGGCAHHPLHFILMADTQLGKIDDVKDGNSFSRETAMLETVMNEINRMEPAPSFVTVCGDMTQIPFHEKQIGEFKRLIGLLNPSIPFHPVSGNHDFAGKPTRENLGRYSRINGPDRYSFESNGVQFIVLNSTLMLMAEQCPDEAEAQWSWLKKTLETSQSSGTAGIVVFMHHPFSESESDEKNTAAAVKGMGRKYLDLFADNGVKAVFSGHLHRTIPERAYRGVRLINSDAVCKSNDGNPGLRVVRVLRDGLHAEYYPFDKLPEKIVV